jgi:hypothetical protein
VQEVDGGVSVDFNVCRILTQITEAGSNIDAEFYGDGTHQDGSESAFVLPNRYGEHGDSPIGRCSKLRLKESQQVPPYVESRSNLAGRYLTLEAA